MSLLAHSLGRWLLVSGLGSRPGRSSMVTVGNTRKAGGTDKDLEEIFMETIATTFAAALLVVVLTLGLGTVNPTATSSNAAPAVWCQYFRVLCPKA